MRKPGFLISILISLLLFLVKDWRPKFGNRYLPTGEEFGKGQDVISCKFDRFSRQGKRILLLKDIPQGSQTIVETAKAAQVKADKRDYIADSIAQTLQEIGFNLTFCRYSSIGFPVTMNLLYCL